MDLLPPDALDRQEVEQAREEAVAGILATDDEPGGRA
jgi:hypothetical protein